MEFQELLKFIKFERGILTKTTGEYEDKEKEIFARTVNVGEEFGELYQEILFHTNLQGKYKKDRFNENNLLGEFADVILTTLFLAEDMHVDIEKALEDKIKKINKRYKK